MLPEFLGRKLLAILLDDEEATAATIHRITLAYRAAHNVHLDAQKAKSTSAATAAKLAKTVKDADHILATIREEVANADYSYFEDQHPDAAPAEIAAHDALSPKTGG